MNEIEISIAGLGDIPVEIQKTFFENFSKRLQQMQSGADIHDSICKSLTYTLYNKPTDMLKQSYQRIKPEEEYKTCNICFENFKTNEYKREVICGHDFHKKCIDTWINKYDNFSCPVCRENVFSKAHQEISFQSHRP